MYRLKRSIQSRAHNHCLLAPEPIILNDMPRKVIHTIPGVTLPEYSLIELAQLFASTSWLPTPGVVKQFKGAVFPSIRANKDNKRRTPIIDNGKIVGLYDDNCTPMWAIMWSHGYPGIGRYVPDYALAHIYGCPQDIDAFTHLANILLVPKFFASLTDGNGPLLPYLKYHSLQVYEWAPKDVGKAEIAKPVGYDSIQWRYLETKPGDPSELIRTHLLESKGEVARILRSIRTD